MLGLGVGMVFVPVSVTSMAGIPSSHAGVASGFLMTGHEIGAALGVAILSAVASSAGSLTTATGAADAFSAGFIGRRGHGCRVRSLRAAPDAGRPASAGAAPACTCTDRTSCSRSRAPETSYAYRNEDHHEHHRHRNASEFDHPRPLDQTSRDARPRRLLEGFSFVAVWVTLGYLLPLNDETYLLMGIPLTIGFQLLVRRRPLRELWVRDATRFTLDKRGLVLAAVLVAAPAYYGARVFTGATGG